LIISEVIARDPESNFSSLTIDKGRKDGILPGMPVFSYMDGTKAIVGIITESAFFTAKIKTFRNRDFTIGVYLNETKVHGIAQGLGDNKNIMSLLYIDKEIQINLKEAVSTSSEGDLFPPDIYIGNVQFIDTTDKTRLTHKAYIKPYVNLQKINEVFVIKKVYGEAKP
jgi:rod shape-determining protein MreC